MAFKVRRQVLALRASNYGYYSETSLKIVEHFANMGIDYYHILHLSRSATRADIKEAYRKLSLKYHPDRNPGDKTAAEMFMVIAEAYDVLVDAKRKAVYDQFGEEVLKRGLPEAKETWDISFSRGYKFHGNAEKVFYDFFGGDSPFAELFESAKSDLNKGFGGLNGRGAKKQSPSVEAQLKLTLEEAFLGCIKKVSIYKRVMNTTGDTSSVHHKLLSISVNRGWVPGTKVIFPKEGDQAPNSIPGDVVLVVTDKPHTRFRREGINLIFVAKITLAQALLGCTLSIQTLDERALRIPITDIVSPGYTKTIHGEGMPVVYAPCNKGDLIIEFDIEFPVVLTSEKKNFIRKALLS